MSISNSYSYPDGAALAAPEASLSDYFQLLKPRVMTLVVFTAFIGLMVAPGNIHPLIGFIAILSLAVGSGAAGALNMWYDRDIDAIMTRTQTRPIPAGKIDPENARDFALTLAVFSVVMMAFAVGFVPAALLAFAIFFYAGFYTMWLKRSTPQNIVIGGAAGAFPPMIGWAAVTQTVSLESIVLFAIIFFWTPPHFWALALKGAEDYKRANIPMLPVLFGPEVTIKHMWLHTIALIAVSILPYTMGFAGAVYATTVWLLNAGFIYYMVKTQRDNRHAMVLFAYSIVYLFMVFGMLLIDNIIAG